MIVGLHGAIGAGKDTVALFLARERGFAIMRVSDAIKREVAMILSRTLEAYVHEHFGAGLIEAEGMDTLIHRLLHLERTPVTRALLQEWGTELRRAESEDYWVRQLAGKLADLGSFDDVVIPDIRFENEARLIRTMRGRLVRIVRPANPAPPSDHRTELALARWGDWDATFVNQNSIEDLEHEVELWLEGLPTR